MSRSLTPIFRRTLELNSVHFKFLLNNWILVVQSLVCLPFCVILGADGGSQGGFRGFPVVSVGRSGALHLGADAPSGLFCRVKTRISAAFALRCGFYSSDVVFRDYCVCFSACLSDLADLFFIFLMRCFFFFYHRDSKEIRQTV